MASRRKLKKSLRTISGELISNCTILNMCGVHNIEKTNALLGKVLNIHNEYVSRLSHTQKGNEKLFYKKLRQDFAKEVEALADEINK